MHSHYVRAVVFVDGQNLYFGAKAAWAPDSQLPSPYAWPSYDVVKLATRLTHRLPGRSLAGIRFYTGVPDLRSARRPRDRFWHEFWNNKLRHLKNQGVHVYRGRVSHAGQEKGVDVSLAVDLVRLTYERVFDLGILVSQDKDYGPAIRLSKAIAASQKRTVEFESAYPVGSRRRSHRGIPGTLWVRIEKSLYDSCLDVRDYRPSNNHL